MSRQSIAETLKEIRKTANLGVDQVVQLLKDQHEINLSNKTLYSYESGHRQPDADTLMALCAIYEIGDILQTFGYKKEDPAAINDEFSLVEKLAPSEQLHIKKYRALDERGKEIVDVVLNTEYDRLQVVPFAVASRNGVNFVGTITKEQADAIKKERQRLLDEGADQSDL